MTKQLPKDWPYPDRQCPVEKHGGFEHRGELQGVPLVLFQNGLYQTEEIKKRFMEVDIQPEILLQTEQLSTIVSLISKNVAAGFMFRPLTDFHPELTSVSLEHPLFVDVSLVWKQNAFWFEVMKIFKSFIRENDIFSGLSS